MCGRSCARAGATAGARRAGSGASGLRAWPQDLPIALYRALPLRMECRPRSRSRRADRAARDPGACAGTPLALAGECSQTRSTRPVLTYYTYKNNLSTLHSITGRISIQTGCLSVRQVVSKAFNLIRLITLTNILV